MHSATKFSLFVVVYGSNLLTLFDLISLPVDKRVDLDGKKKVEFVWDLHKWVKLNIERKSKQCVTQAKYQVWVHM